jgi:hypothetical protein
MGIKAVARTWLGMEVILRDGMLQKQGARCAH